MWNEVKELYEKNLFKTKQAHPADTYESPLKVEHIHSGYRLVSCLSTVELDVSVPPGYAISHGR